MPNIRATQITHPSIFRWGLALLLFLGLLMMVGSMPARAAQPTQGLEWTAEPLFDGVVKPGNWLPVRVTLINQGPDRLVEVRTSVTDSEGQTHYIYPVELPNGAQKQVLLYVLPTNFTRQLFLSLWDDTGEISRSAVNVRIANTRELLIGVVARTPEPLASLKSVPIESTFIDDIRLLSFDIQNIPDRAAGLASFDAIILNDVDTSRLSQTQQQALAGWVEQGGHLILGGGIGTAITFAGLPARLVPGTLVNTQSLPSLPDLEAIGGEPVRVSGPFVVAHITPQESTVLATQGNIPLIVEKSIGQGRVTFLSLDLTLAPFGSWAGEKKLWTVLLSANSKARFSSAGPASSKEWADEQMTFALGNLPSLDLPSVRWVVLLLLIYIFLVGPVNYMALRQLDRLEWAWLTIPALTLVFSLGAYGIGYGLRGGEVILNKISTIELLPESEMAQVETYVGLFSPSRKSYTLTLEGQPLVRRLNPRYSPFGSSRGNTLTIVQGTPTQIRDLSVNQWAMQTFAAEQMGPISIQIQSQLIYQDAHIRGTISNPAPYALENVVLVVAGEANPVGTISAGQTIDVDFRINPASNVFGPPLSYLILEEEFSNPGTRGYSRETELKRQILDSIFMPPYEPGYVPESGPLLIGWLKESPLAILVEGRTAQELNTTLVIARPTLQFGGVNLHIPPGLIPMRLIQQSGEVSPCSGGRGLGFFIQQGHIIMEYVLPPQLHGAAFDTLELILETDGGRAIPPVIALYNWETQQWDPLEDVDLGTNRIDQATRYIAQPQYTLRVQIQIGNNQGGCLYPNIALEGTRLEKEVRSPSPTTAGPAESPTSRLAMPVESPITAPND